MNFDEAKKLKTFQNHCTCGGFAWSINGRNPANPHMNWCPQKDEYHQWYTLVGKDIIKQ